MPGLKLDVRDAQAIAILTAFETELISKFPSNLGSTMLVISPLASVNRTHWLMWGFSSSVLHMAGRLVIICRRTTPKLKTSLFSFSQPLFVMLHETMRNRFLCQGIHFNFHLLMSLILCSCYLWKKCYYIYRYGFLLRIKVTRGASNMDRRDVSATIISKKSG